MIKVKEIQCWAANGPGKRFTPYQIKMTHDRKHAKLITPIRGQNRGPKATTMTIVIWVRGKRACNITKFV